MKCYQNIEQIKNSRPEKAFNLSYPNFCWYHFPYIKYNDYKFMVQFLELEGYMISPVPNNLMIHYSVMVLIKHDQQLFYQFLTFKFV
jgi:hypothetical protein